MEHWNASSAALKAEHGEIKRPEGIPSGLAVCQIDALTLFRRLALRFSKPAMTRAYQSLQLISLLPVKIDLPFSNASSRR